MGDKFHVAFAPINAGDITCKNVAAANPQDAVKKVETKHQLRGNAVEAAVLRNSSSCPHCGSKTINQ
jgi:hypothetical protein